MSYILGALKKADRERRRETEVKVADWDQDAWSDPTPADNTSRWLIGLATTGLILVLAVFGFVAFRVLESVPQSQPHTAAEDASPNISPDFPAADVATNEEQQLPVSAVDQRVEEGSFEGAADEASESVSEALPEFSGHLYFPGNPAMSRIFAGSSSYREGELINGYRVEQILEEQLVLSKDGEEIRIGL